MKSVLLLFFVVFAASITGLTQTGNFWKDVSETTIQLNQMGERSIEPVKYRTLSLDLEKLDKYLGDVPSGYEESVTNEAMVLEIPLPDGTFQEFEIWESPVMQPGLAKRFPSIRSFAGRNKQTGAIIHFDLGDEGFHGAIRSAQGTYYIDPYAEGQKDFYISYNVKDHKLDLTGIPATACGYDFVSDQSHQFLKEQTNQDSKVGMRGGAQVNLKTYILAMACTGEYGRSKGGTVSAVLSTFNTAVNRINLIYQPEVAVKLVLHEETDKLIFTDPNIDPYVNSNVGGELLGQNANVINARISASSYDIGHVFTLACTDVGGVASGTTCTSGKARGVTCHYSSSVTFIAVEVAAHEMGHQCSVSHSWDNCPGNDGQRASGRAFEPGSGTTIMSYAGSCGSQNIQNNSDDYYSIGSLEQFIFYSREGGGSVCGLSEPVNNHEPDIFLNYSAGFYIPVSTPFQLTAEATDPDGDEINYCWEQYDLETVPTVVGNPMGNSPIYRTYRPTTQPTRTFPRLDLLLGGGFEPYEILADYSRDFNFKVTVRDNHPVAGGTVWEQVSFKSTATAGPFRVISQASDTVKWEVGSEVEVVWDVANTDQAPVNCNVVNIKLSLDEGYTYPFTLAANTPNDGIEKVFVPDALTTLARVKVEAADNIFFNINEKLFEIIPATTPGYTVNVQPTYHYACLPDDFSISIETDQILNFDNPIDLEILGFIPAGAEVNLSQTRIFPGDDASIQVTLDNGLGTGTLEFDLRMTADGVDTIIRHFVLDLVSNDFSNLALELPLSGASGVQELPVFSWNGADDAQLYDIQIATNPAFRPEDIVYDVSGIADTSFQPSQLLEENTAYYWRIRPHNICGFGEYTTPSAFHTFAKVCRKEIGLEGDESRIPITGVGRPTISSTISLLESGIINDLNVPNIRGSYDPVSSIRLTLKSPAGTEAILFEKRCSGTVFNFGFDDAIPNRNPCPSFDGKIRGPQDLLNRFNGESIEGTWTLQLSIEESGNGGGGSLEEWTLEFCGDIALEPPFFIRNDTLRVPNGVGKQISREFLEVDDLNNTQHELTYTIVTVPDNGAIFLNSVEVHVGDQFTQGDINAGQLWYEHNGSNTNVDGFTFTVRDAEGGWLATPRFNIVIDDAVGTFSPELGGKVNLIPNPASDVFMVDPGATGIRHAEISVTGLQGQVFLRMQQDFLSSQRLRISAAGLPTGMYFVHFNTDQGWFTKKLVIQK